MLIGFGLLVGIGLNMSVAPQIMTPRPPIFSAADIAANWEWRSMAIGTHGYWMSTQFPDAHLIHTGDAGPPKEDGSNPIGIQINRWAEILDLDVSIEGAPFDLVGMDVKEQLSAFQKLYSRIDCRIDPENSEKDTCYYFVAWDEESIGAEPTFVGVLTSDTAKKEEFGLVELTLLERITGLPASALPVMGETNR